MSLKKTPETLADILNNSSVGAELAREDQFIARVGDMKERHPAELAIAIRAQYTDDEVASFADPWSVQKNNLDGRGMLVIGNLVPIWDKAEAEDPVTKVTIKHDWYERFASRLRGGAFFAERLDLFTRVNRAVKANDGSITGMETKVTVDGAKDHEGVVQQVEVDARMMSEDERKSYISTYKSRLTAVANCYRNAVAIVRMWDDITTRMGKKVRVRWNFIDPQADNPVLKKNKTPIRVIMINQDGSDGVAEDVRISRFLSYDVDAAVAAGGTWRNLVDSKFKLPDNRAGAGQGETDEAARRKSRIKATGENSMKDVLNECVAFFMDDETVSAFKHSVHQMKRELSDDIWSNMVELHALLTDIINDDMRASFNRVQKAAKELADKEKEAKAKALAEREQVSAQPTQHERNEALNKDAEKALNEKTPEPAKKTAAVGGKKRAAV